MIADPAGFLGQMAQRSRERVERARALVPDPAMRERASGAGPVRPLVLQPDGFDLIAEVKLLSPSEGVLARPATPGAHESGEEGVAPLVTAQVRRYAQAGAAAISVLTEPTRFGGSLDHVTWASNTTETPILRKDFLVDPYQILEARAVGASGVLLIVRILDDDRIVQMTDVARALGMFVLIESFDPHDIERIARLWPGLDGLGGVGSSEPPVLLGVNCRDLASLEVEFDRLIELAPRLPADAPWVAESGLATPADAREVARAGYRLALVGSALMRSDEPAELLAGLLGAGREEVGCASV